MGKMTPRDPSSFSCSGRMSTAGGPSPTYTPLSIPATSKRPSYPLGVTRRAKGGAVCTHFCSPTLSFSPPHACPPDGPFTPHGQAFYLAASPSNLA